MTQHTMIVRLGEDKGEGWQAPGVVWRGRGREREREREKEKEKRKKSTVKPLSEVAT